MTQSSVSVVIVSFNTMEKLRRALAAVEPEHEVIVVDNASTDGSPEMVESEFPDVRLIRNTENKGFGAANNQGLDAITRPIALLLNSDCYADPGAITLLANHFVDPDVVAAGGRLLNPDGTFQNSAASSLNLWAVFCEQTLLEKLLPWSRTFSPYWVSNRMESTGEVRQVMGACLMMRPLERFDERFFLYVEDTELCYRLRKRGKILFVPDARFTHDLGSSSASRWEAIARYNRGKELFFSIHKGPLQTALVWLLNRLGALLRLIGWGVPTLLTLGTVPRLRKKAAMFARVLFAPIQGPPRP